MKACLEGKEKYERPRYGVFNIGSPGYCELSNSAKWISSEMGLNPKFKYTGGRQGWIGDNPFLFLILKKFNL